MLRSRAMASALWMLLLLPFLARSLAPESSISFDALTGKKVLVVGGSGRVGGSVVTQLVKRKSHVVVGGTSLDNFSSAQKRWQSLFPDVDKELSRVAFAELDRENEASVSAILLTAPEPFDLVIHTAGPFQGKVKSPNGVLEACVQTTTPYIDVCDDYCTASAAKTKYANRAKCPCILSTGCWPGVSSLMAKQLVSKTLKAYPNLTPEDLSVDFGFFTAGSGGAGATLLVATFLILAEKALTVQNGRRRQVDAMKQYSRVDFGGIVGVRDIAHLNLLETASIHDVLGVGSVKSLFGTAPDFWNTLLGFMAQLPPSLLSNEGLMRRLSVFSLPLVRLVDRFAGATNAMRCDVSSDKEPSLRATAIYAHSNLEPCVGECVVAFASAVLSGAAPPGLWFPEEAIQAGPDAASVLNLAAVGAHTTQVKSDGKVTLATEEVWGRRIP